MAKQWLNKKQLDRLRGNFSDEDSFEAILAAYEEQSQFEAGSVVSVEDLSDNDLRHLFGLAYLFQTELLGKRQKKIGLLKGKSIINFFCEESTRTRSSFELAGKHLGADTINVTGKGSSMKKKGETLFDTARTLNRLDANLIIVRDAHGLSPEMMDNEIQAPIINAGDGWHEHPSQSLLDAYTIISEFGDVKGRTLALIGDVVHSRVAGSLIRMMNRIGVKVRLVGPPTLMPRNAEEVFDVEVYNDMNEGVAGVDVMYALRIQRERMNGAYIPSVRDYSKLYCVNESRLPLVSEDAIVMHAGPINRGVDITMEVMEGPHSRVEQMVANGLPVRMGLIYSVIRNTN